jgi:hypothetical protein
MANLNDIYRELSELHITIKLLLNHANYKNYEDLSGIDYDRTDSEQLFFADELIRLLEKLDGVLHVLDYLSRPVKFMGTLHKNQRDRYEVENGHEFTSGCGIEYLATDDLHCRFDEKLQEYVNVPYWCSSRVEHNGTDYYIVGCSDSLENMKVRYR